MVPDWSVSRIILIFIVPIYSDPARFFELEDVEHLYNIAKHLSEGVDIFLDILKPLENEIEIVGDLRFDYGLRIAREMNNNLLKNAEHLYECTIARVDWRVPYESDAEMKEIFKELEHADNYSKVLKEALTKIHSRNNNSTTDHVGNECQIMPRGPIRVMEVVHPPPKKQKQLASAQHNRSTMDAVLLNVQEGISAKIKVFELIQEIMGYMRFFDLPEMTQIQQKISFLHEKFWTLTLRMINSARASENLEIGTEALEKSTSLVNLLLSTKNSLLPFEELD
ncbi:hypothetical protein GE061_008143 [Apolygus lucorum]|uniref:Uncharacterized protein n=1 Tax=Apolygus lucorum TaxID=248454 RepID=A0A6A4IN23_APOLU|nr:hypothetical protein GE061_008143 [Apolygus lucorum]